MGPKSYDADWHYLETSIEHIVEDPLLRELLVATLDLQQALTAAMARIEMAEDRHQRHLHSPFGNVFAYSPRDKPQS